MASPSNAVTVHLPVGTVAALLTSSEYLLSTVAALSARAAVHGHWLYALHRGGEASIDVAARMKRNVRKDLIGFFIGIWLVIAVALVESDLQASVVVHKTDILKSPALCVGVHRPYDPLFIDSLVPAMRAVVEPWVLGVVETLSCGARGIASVGAGGATDMFGQKTEMCAPVCSDANPVHAPQVSVSPTEVDLSTSQMTMRPGKTPAFELLPYSSRNLGFGADVFPSPSDVYNPLSACARAGISPYFVGLSSPWMTVFAKSYNVSAVIHGLLCQTHSPRPVVPVKDVDAVRCATLDQHMHKIDIDCIRRMSPWPLRQQAVLDDLSALFIAHHSMEPSFACINASVSIEYVFLSSSVINRVHKAIVTPFPVLIPLRVRALRGHCERTVHVLARSALVYSADAEWMRSDLARLDRRARYYAYMVAVASSQFPLTLMNDNFLHGDAPDGADGELAASCELRAVSEVTLIPWGWRLWLLILGVVAASVVMVCGLVLRVVFCGESWKVGSAHWSLSRILDNGPWGTSVRGRESPTVVVQVVAMEETTPKVNGGSVGGGWDRPFARNSNGSGGGAANNSEGVSGTRAGTDAGARDNVGVVSDSPADGSMLRRGRQAGGGGLLTFFSPRERHVQYRVRTSAGGDGQMGVYGYGGGYDGVPMVGGNMENGGGIGVWGTVPLERSVSDGVVMVTTGRSMLRQRSRVSTDDGGAP